MLFNTDKKKKKTTLELRTSMETTFFHCHVENTRGYLTLIPLMNVFQMQRARGGLSQARASAPSCCTSLPGKARSYRSDTQQVRLKVEETLKVES